jgi:hypothetical protein
MAELAAAIKKPEDPLVTQREPFAFTALIAFSVLYFARPEDVLHILAVIPLGKITGGVALLALIVELRKRRRVKMPLALKFLLLLFVQMCATIPFAYWKGGAFSMVFSSFSEAVNVTVLVSMLVTTLPQLRKLIFVQAAAVSFLTLVSVAVHNSDNGGRLSGVAGGVFENPNDLAINIAINFPFCFAFFLGARGALRKALWGGQW